MSQIERIHLRTTKEFKENTRLLIEELYEFGFMDKQNLSQYVIAAVREKRQRDRELIDSQWKASGIRRCG